MAKQEGIGKIAMPMNHSAKNELGTVVIVMMGEDKKLVKQCIMVLL